MTTTATAITAPTMSQIFGPIWLLELGICEASSLHSHLVRLPSAGLSLTKGPGGLRYADGQVVCPWHNSRFDLASGENLNWAPGFAGRDMPRWSRKMIAHGRKPSPLTTYDVMVEGDDVYVEL